MLRPSSSPKVPTFDGTVSAQFRPWIIQFEAIARHQQCPRSFAHGSSSSRQTWGQFNSGIGIDGQFQLRNWNWNWNCLFEKIIELELHFFELELKLEFKFLELELELELKFATKKFKSTNNVYHLIWEFRYISSMTIML